MGFISHHEMEWRSFLGFMDAVIMSEFGEGKVFDPGVRIFTTIDAKIGFEFLVHAFCLSISLRMVCGGEGIGVLEEAAEF